MIAAGLHMFLNVVLVVMAFRLGMDYRDIQIGQARDGD